MSKLNRNSLTAPFPYHGGKRRWADEIWARFGEVDIYSEPFAGTLAVLLGNPHPANREIVADTNGHICNFWRAIRNDPEGAAYWADYPTTHHDLTARHKWLIEWGATASDNLLNDAEWYDVKAAGWWVWGISNWIGGGWCVVSGDWMPAVANGTNGGVSAQRVNLPVLRDKIPRVSPKNGSEGVSAQRVNVPDQMPSIDNWGCGKGVQARRVQLLSHSYDEPGARLVDWFCALSDRLARVITLNRDWSSAVTNTLLQRTAHSPKGRVVGVFLDPPYRVDTGRFKAYQSDYNGEGSDAAVDSYLWAVENGEELRIAYACHAGDFVVPDGWTAIEKSFTRGRKGAVDQVMFSPACLDPSAEAPAPVHDETTARLL